MKIFFLYKFIDGPWGGGNQFLKALRREFVKRNVYTEDIMQADVVLFNANKGNFFDNIDYLYELKQSGKTLIMRVGGLFQNRNPAAAVLDQLMIDGCNELADGCFFVSQWMYETLRELGFGNPTYSVIRGAVDSSIFNTQNRKKFNPATVKLVNTTWSAHPNKGFAAYEYLDKQLDFGKYSMTLYGPSPVSFQNIKQVAPVKTEELAVELKQQDIFVTATLHDAYSNSILEAQASGLPVVAIASGGNKEVVGPGGVLFRTKEELLPAIEEVTKNYDKYQKVIKPKSIEEVADEYMELINKATTSKTPLPPRNFLTKAQAKIEQFEQRQKATSMGHGLRQAKRNLFFYFKHSFSRNLLERWLKQKRKLVHGQILDIGSKNRRYDKFFGGTITAIDLKPDPERGVEYGDIEAGLKYPDNSYDSILCLEVLEYLKEPRKAVAEMYRLLKPGGVALISVPFMHSEHNDYSRLTRHAVQELTSKFSEVEIKTSGNAWTITWDILRKKLFLGKARNLRKLIFLLISPFLLFIRLLRLDRKPDEHYYSSLLITLKK